MSLLMLKYQNKLNRFTTAHCQIVKCNILTLSPKSPGLPGFTLQTADDESRFTEIRTPLLYFLLKTVQT